MIHTKFYEDLFYGSLIDIELKLKKFNFLYIHRSYLVNSLYVKIYEYDKVILLDDTILPIGSSKRSEICKRGYCRKRKDRRQMSYELI